MFAQGLSGRHNTLSVARPHWMFCVPAPSHPPRVFVDAHLSGIFVRWMEKRVILLLRWAVGATEASARFQWARHGGSSQTLPEGNPQRGPDTTL